MRSNSRSPGTARRRKSRFSAWCRSCWGWRIGPDPRTGPTPSPWRCAICLGPACVPPPKGSTPAPPPGPAHPAPGDQPAPGGVQLAPPGVQPAPPRSPAGASGRAQPAPGPGEPARPPEERSRRPRQPTRVLEEPDRDRLPPRRRAGPAGSTWPGRRGPAGSGRCRLPGPGAVGVAGPDRRSGQPGVPPHPHPRARGRPRPLRLPDPGRAGLLRGSHRRPRGWPGGGAGPALRPLPDRPAAGRTRRRCRRPDAGARHRQEDGRSPDRGVEGSPRHRPRHAPTSSWWASRPGGTAPATDRIRPPRRSPGPRCGPPSPGSGTPRTRSATPCPACPPTAPSRIRFAWPCASWRAPDDRAAGGSTTCERKGSTAP